MNQATKDDESPAWALVLLLMLPAICWVETWYVWQLWKWYAVPFFGAPAVSMRAVFGLMVIAQVLRSSVRKDRFTPREMTGKAIDLLLTEGLFVLVAWGMS
jgi:hypothetical protein